MKSSMTKKQSRLYPRGFTLLEIVVALAIIAVAVAIVVVLYQASSLFAEDSRDFRVAMRLAEERLQDILLNSAAYELSSKLSSQPVEIKNRSGEQGFSSPLSIPPDKRAGIQNKNLYDKFAWRAFAKLPNEGRDIVELTVIVEWQLRGKDKSYVVTQYVPKSKLGGVI